MALVRTCFYESLIILVNCRVIMLQIQYPIYEVGKLLRMLFPLCKKGVSQILEDLGIA